MVTVSLSMTSPCCGERIVETGASLPRPGSRSRWRSTQALGIAHGVGEGVDPEARRIIGRVGEALADLDAAIAHRDASRAPSFTETMLKGSPFGSLSLARTSMCKTSPAKTAGVIVDGDWSALG